MSAEAEALALLRSLQYQSNKLAGMWRTGATVDDTLSEIAEARRLLNKIENAVRRTT